MVFNIHHNFHTGDTRTTDVDDSTTYDGYRVARPHPNARPGLSYHAWRWSRRKIETESEDLEFVETGGQLRIFTKIRDVEGMAVKDLIIGPSTTTGQEDMASLGLDRVFETAKPVAVLDMLIAASAAPDSLVLDFFAGSGTTGHAVSDLNREDRGNRKFVLVQLPEKTDRDDYGTVADITKERVRRAIGKLNTEDPGGATQDRGFRVFKLAESNIAAWDGGIAHDEGALAVQLELHVDHVRDDRSADDVLYEILLKSGFPLSTRVESIEIEATAVTSVAEGALLICLDQALSLELVRAVAARKPERAVFLDEGFASNDALKANAAQVFKAAGVTFRTV